MNKTKKRKERDSLGDIKVSEDALYGAQTQRAVENFSMSGLGMPRDFIRALGMIKEAAARVNGELGFLDAERAGAIAAAAAEVEAGSLDAHFPVDVFQTGSGTSTNMNANEVIARIASDRLGRPVHPNDHVNLGQSSNDVIPTAIHASACMGIGVRLLPALEHLQAVIEKRARELDKVVKTGRTHMMDALPVTFGQELGGWAAQVGLGRERIESSLERLRALALGGTAVGTGVNTHPEFAERVIERLAEKTGIPFRKADNPFEAQSSRDAAVEMSGQLKTLAVSLAKISSDLILMNSGPHAGLGEITLPALQPGSSIMPGKVNPVIPEAAAMACVQVMGSDAAITAAGAGGRFQLNAMLPLIAHNLLQSILLLSNAARLLADKAIAGFRVNEKRVEELLSRNPVLVTALVPAVGYDKAAEIARDAFSSGRPLLDVAKEKTDLPEEELRTLLDPARLVGGHNT